MLMHETSLKNAITTQPQVREHGGTRVWRRADALRAELAFATAYAFSGCRSGVLHETVIASMDVFAQVRSDDALYRPGSISCGPSRSAVARSP